MLLGWQSWVLWLTFRNLNELNADIQPSWTSVEKKFHSRKFFLKLWSKKVTKVAILSLPLGLLEVPCAGPVLSQMCHTAWLCQHQSHRGQHKEFCWPSQAGSSSGMWDLHWPSSGLEEGKRQVKLWVGGKEVGGRIGIWLFCHILTLFLSSPDLHINWVFPQSVFFLALGLPQTCAGYSVGNLVCLFQLK